VHPVKRAGSLALDDERTRRWVTNLRRPERLDDPVVREVLRAHGRAASGNPLDVGRAAAALLREKIDALCPPEDATTAERLPHLVLTTCFVEGAKSYQAAARLGLSERQLSRERGRAVSLLTAELARAPAARRGAPPPRERTFVPRPALAARLDDLLARSRRVHVHGPPGAGKTHAVAAFADAQERAVHWLTVPRLGAELSTLLFDLGEILAPDDPALAAYMHGSLPAPNPGLATRLALRSLGGCDRLLVFDAADPLAGDAATAAFLDEAAARLPLLRIVTVGRAAGPGPGLAVPPFTDPEVRALLDLRSVPDAPALAPRLRAWTRGNARLVDLSARLAGAASPGEAAAAAAALRAAVRREHLVTCARAVARAA
jgi:hypothetical protein